MYVYIRVVKLTIERTLYLFFYYSTELSVNVNVRVDSYNIGTDVGVHAKISVHLTLNGWFS